MPPKKNREHWDGSEYVYERGDIETKFFGDSGLERSGYVATINGYVYVWAARWNDGRTASRLEFIHGGRKWRREYEEIFMPRTLVTLAKEFAAEIAEKGQPK